MVFGLSGLAFGKSRHKSTALSKYVVALIQTDIDKFDYFLTIQTNIESAH